MENIPWSDLIKKKTYYKLKWSIVKFNFLIFACDTEMKEGIAHTKKKSES